MKRYRSSIKLSRIILYVIHNALLWYALVIIILVPMTLILNLAVEIPGAWELSRGLIGSFIILTILLLIIGILYWSPDTIRNNYVEIDEGRLIVRTTDFQYRTFNQIRISNIADMKHAYNRKIR